MIAGALVTALEAGAFGFGVPWSALNSVYKIYFVIYFDRDFRTEILT